MRQETVTDGGAQTAAGENSASPADMRPNQEFFKLLPSHGSSGIV